MNDERNTEQRNTEQRNREQGNTEQRDSHRVKRFEEWLAEKAVFERIQLERQRKFELERASKIAEYMSEKISHGMSFDQWLKEKREASRVSNQKASECQEKSSEETRKIEAARKYEEWLEMKFKQEMEHEEQLLKKKCKTKSKEDERKHV